MCLTPGVSGLHRPPGSFLLGRGHWERKRRHTSGKGVIKTPVPPTARYTATPPTHQNTPPHTHTNTHTHTHTHTHTRTPAPDNTRPSPTTQTQQQTHTHTHTHTHTTTH